MVQKAFFIEYAKQEVMHQVMSLVRPYPDFDALQGTLLLLLLIFLCRA